MNDPRESNFGLFAVLVSLFDKAPARLAQEFHLVPVVFAPFAQRQMDFQPHFFGQGEFSVLCFRQQLRRIFAGQHGCSPAENQLFSRQRRNPLRAR